MKYIVTSTKSVAQAAIDLESAVKKHKVGVLHTLNLRQTLHSKGFELANDCLVFDVCNPQKAKDVLDMDMSMNLALPCRISVYSENQQTYIGMISPKAMLAMLSDSTELATAASEVESTLQTIINEAAH